MRLTSFSANLGVNQALGIVSLLGMHGDSFVLVTNNSVLKRS